MAINSPQSSNEYVQRRSTRIDRKFCDGLHLYLQRRHGQCRNCVPAGSIRKVRVLRCRALQETNAPSDPLVCYLSGRALPVYIRLRRLRVHALLCWQVVQQDGADLRCSMRRPLLRWQVVQQDGAVLRCSMRRPLLRWQVVQPYWAELRRPM